MMPRRPRTPVPRSEAQQQRLELVVAVMRRQQPFAGREQLCERAVARIARGRLEPLARLRDRRPRATVANSAPSAAAVAAQCALHAADCGCNPWSTCAARSRAGKLRRASAVEQHRRVEPAAESDRQTRRQRLRPAFERDAQCGADYIAG